MPFVRTYVPPDHIHISGDSSILEGEDGNGKAFYDVTFPPLDIAWGVDQNGERELPVQLPPIRVTFRAREGMTEEDAWRAAWKLVLCQLER